ncbi:MAG: DNA primase [Deltaproteobacteria bacterium]|nr:DNA primase [Deltaproteobacteria bacterium]
MSSRFREFVEAVRGRTDVVELIGADIELRPSGKTLKGLSPFHTETHPSFVVWPDTQTWHDFSNGGGLGGDVFSYLQEREKCGFKEALFALAERTGIRRPDQDDEQYQREVALLVERRDVERLLGQAAAHYHRVLPTKIREEWFRSHYGFTDETIDGLLLGWADGHLFDHVREGLGVGRELALKTGLFVVVAGGHIEDFFCDRLVFPYWRNGHVVYFIARSTQFTGDEEWEKAKYKKLLTHSEKHAYVSPTVGNDYFYNEDAARGAEELVVTEGVTDCISAMQAGLACISPVTTRFRERDLPKLLGLTRWAKKIVICNDAESSGAGEAGAIETAAALHREGRDVRIALLPRPDGADKIDLNEFLKAHTPDELGAVLAAARRYPEHLIERIPHSTAPADLTALLRPVLEAIATAVPLERDGYLDTIGKRFGIKRRTLGQLLRQLMPKERSEKVSSPERGTAASERGERVRGEVFEEPGHYYVINRDGDIEVLSSFSIVPTQRVVCESDELLVGDMRTEGGSVLHDVLFPKTAWHSKRDLLRALPSPDLQWTGSDDQVQGLLRLLSSHKVPRRQGTLNLGYIETAAGPRWVAPGVVIAPDGFRDADEVLYVPNPSSFAKRLRYAPTPLAEARALAAQVLPALLELNEPAVMLPIIGWFFATPFRPRLLRLLGHFPILVIWGTQGSGKTSIVKEVLWPLFGVVNKTDPFSATETEFALIKLLSSTDSVPIFIDEYKPRDMPKQRLDRLNRLLRRIYGGETEERGRPDLTVASYALSAPVCLAGESRPEGDAALVERMISVSPNKNRLDAHPEHRAAFERVRQLDLGGLAAPYIQFALGRDAAADIRKARAVTDSLVAEIPNATPIPPRCHDNLVVTVFGLTMFEAFAESLGVTLPELDIVPATNACIVDLLDGDGGAKDPFDQFLEALSTYALMGALQESRHYAMVNGLLCLHLPTCYQVYLTERGRAHQEDDTNGLRALKRIVREKLERKSYVVEVDKRVSLGDQFVRTVAIDPEKVPESLDVEEFPIQQDRTWGGERAGSPSGWTAREDDR